MRFGGVKIVMVAAGAFHSMAVTADGDVYTWGSGKYGCLGLNDEEERLIPTKLHRELLGGSNVVLVAANNSHSVALTAIGSLFAWGHGLYGQLGLGDKRNRLTPAHVGAEETFESKVRMAACGESHTLAVTEAGFLWSWGVGEFGALGQNSDIDMLIPTRIDAQHFDSAKIVTATARTNRSTAVTEDGALYTWGRGFDPHQIGTPTGLGHADLQHKFVPTRIASHLLQGARVGRCHSLPPEHALAFAMGTHSRLGSVQATAIATASGADSGTGHAHMSILDDNLVKMVVDMCAWWPEGGAGELEGVVRLVGGGRIREGE